MEDAVDWTDLRERCASLEPGTELVTPVSERRFEVRVREEGRLGVRFRDSGETRTLERDGFEAVVSRLREDGLELSSLTPGIEPYATLSTLSPRVAVEGDRLVLGEDEESPYLVTPAAARTRPERLHDDALLLADVLERVGDEPFDHLETETLTDLYVLLSDVSRGADRLRRDAGSTLVGRLGGDQTVHGRFGSVHRTTRTRHRLRDNETVLDALDDHGIPREWALGVDAEKLDVVIATTDLDASEVYDEETQTYAQKTSVEEGEKYDRLQGLAARLEELEGRAGDELREDLTHLEHRLEEALSAD
ncbi:hypothetical protein [Natronobiforma cellulositropha]|uniref:hypothetical protein n=1 Tax=Natronobiforma cellulositropha TaxID=1679076 RepID=UPI0021D570EA|nr:hypothetical protein [Natronobiforma cellulositropha]